MIPELDLSRHISFRKGLDLVCSLVLKINLVVSSITTLPLTNYHSLDSARMVDQAGCRTAVPLRRVYYFQIVDQLG